MSQNSSTQPSNATAPPPNSLPSTPPAPDPASVPQTPASAAGPQTIQKNGDPARSSGPQTILFSANMEGKVRVTNKKAD